jgi:alpha-N-arabinofuranosidase
MDGFIEEVIAIADSVAEKRNSTKRIMLSFDEWNVWYRTRRRHLPGRTIDGWPVAPPILEEVYSMKDALAFGGACISLLNHADRVKAACLAQLVNAIAPIMTEAGGPAWRQTIFYPFKDFSNYGRGTVLSLDIDTPTYATVYHDPRGTTDLEFPMPAVPFLKASAVASHDGKSLALFLLNRSLNEEMPVEIYTDGFGVLSVVEATVLADADLDAVNTKDAQERVSPVRLAHVRADNGKLEAKLKPASWSTIRLKSE